MIWSRVMDDLSYEYVYNSLYEAVPPTNVTVGDSSADIISIGRGFLSAFDLTMQLQVGCPGGCLFCYVPEGRRLTPHAIKGHDGRDWGFQVRNKQHVIPKLRRHLESGALADKIIYWSGITDPYASSPKITRQLWELLSAAPLDYRPRRIVVQSRFRADRDAKIMGEYARSTPTADGGPSLVISYSMGTDRNDFIRAWERATPTFEQRMKTINTLREAGLFVVTTLSPLAYWNELRGTLKTLQDWGVSYITALFFKANIRTASTPPRFLSYLQAEHPILLDPNWQADRTREMESVYGANRVLIGQDGFVSLAAPHRVLVFAE